MTHERALRKLLVLGLLVWLPLRGASAAFSIARSLVECSPRRVANAFLWSEEQRIHETLLLRDRELDLKPGYHQRLMSFLDQHLPQYAVVHLGKASAEAPRIYLPLHTLLFPRTFNILGPRHLDPARFRANEFFLDFAGEHASLLQGALVPVASAEDWTLWKKE